MPTVGAQQGFAARGKESTYGNFVCFLKLRAPADETVKSWLDRITISCTIQNEILPLMSHEVLRNICHKINGRNTLMNRSEEATTEGDDIIKRQKKTFGVIIMGHTTVLIMNRKVCVSDMWMIFHC